MPHASDGPDVIAGGLSADAWQLLVDSASDAYVCIDGAGVVLRWNVPAVEMFGWERHEAVGTMLADLIVPPGYRQAHLLGIRRFVASGHGEAVFRRLQLPALHRTGRRVEVEFTILPVEDAGTGWQFHSFLRDVTAELAQQRYVELLQRVALAANEAGSVETALRSGVEAVEQLTGSRWAHVYLVEPEPRPRLIPTGWWFPAPVEPLREATAATTFNVGEGLPGRVAASGEPAWIADISHDDNLPRARAALESGVRAAFAFPVMTQDRPVAVIELFLDHPGEPDADLLDIMRSVGSQLGRVFERQQSIDELRRVAADREALVSIVGHELRGPLAAAHAAAGMLADSASFGDKADMSELLDRQLGRLRRLVDMFLTAQRLEAGSVTAHPRPVAVGALVGEVITDGDFGQVEATIDDDARVHVDPDHLAQMLWNLLGNATRHGKPPVRVTAERDDNAVTIAVADAGPGVPTELRPHLFDRFARGTASHGTGLGLAIVRGLARANHGDAQYIHIEATGAAFELRLPAA